ncbi:MAG: phosphotransferase [Bacteroidales bacterium]|nr:phosphotransferase [Bacteroidales bacterium]
MSDFIISEPLLVSLADYVPEGGGATGDSFYLKTDPTVLLKLFHEGKTQQSMDELRLSHLVYSTGIPTPEPGDYVTTADGRRGIRYRRIIGKKSYARAVSDNPEKVQFYAEEFAGMCKRLHSVHLDTTQFENVKERYGRMLEANPFFTKTEKDKLARFIADAPDRDTAIHGDLQFGNAIFVDDKRYFIDLGDFCYGYPMFDVAMVYLCCYLSREEFIQEVYHLPKTLSRRFWDCFAPVYFGKDRPLSSIEEEIRPYAGLKTLMIERETKEPMPEFREALRSILS